MAIHALHFAATEPSEPMPLDEAVPPTNTRRAYIPAGCDDQGRIKPGRVQINSEPRQLTMGAWMIGAVIVGLAVWAFVAIGFLAVFP